MGNAFFDSFNKSFNESYDAAESERRDLNSFKKKEEWKTDFARKQAEIDEYKATRSTVSKGIKTIAGIMDVSDQEAARMFRGKTLEQVQSEIASLQKMRDSNDPSFAALRQKYFSKAPPTGTDVAEPWDPEALASEIAQEYAPMPAETVKKPGLIDDAIDTIGGWFSSAPPEGQEPAEDAKPQQRTLADLGEGIRFEAGEITPDAVLARSDAATERSRKSQRYVMDLRAAARADADELRKKALWELGQNNRDMDAANNEYQNALNNPNATPEELNKASLKHAKLAQNAVRSDPKKWEGQAEKLASSIANSSEVSMKAANLDGIAKDPEGWLKSKIGVPLGATLNDKFNRVLEKEDDLRNALGSAFGINPDTLNNKTPADVIREQLDIAKGNIVYMHTRHFHQASAVADRANGKVVHTLPIVIAGMSPEDTKKFDDAFLMASYTGGFDLEQLKKHLRDNVNIESPSALERFKEAGRYIDRKDDYVKAINAVITEAKAKKDAAKADAATPKGASGGF